MIAFVIFSQIYTKFSNVYLVHLTGLHIIRSGGDKALYFT